MKKIISLFKRNYGEGERLVYDEIVEGAEWVMEGEGDATEKLDGTACMIEGGKLFKRFDCKKGRKQPAAFIPAEPAPNEQTGHWPGWLPVGDGPEDKWHIEALRNIAPIELSDNTYELVGPKVQSNPYNLSKHLLFRHGDIRLHPIRDFESLKRGFTKAAIEGIVWHHSDGRMVKIKAKDFGIKHDMYRDSVIYKDAS